MHFLSPLSWVTLFFLYAQFHMEICQSKLPIFWKFYNKCERWRFCRVNFAPKKICSRTFFSQSSWYIRDFLSGLPKVILWLLWGGLGPLENIKKEFLSDPILQQVTLKPIKVMITCKNSDRNIKIQARLIDFKILKNEIFHGLDEQKNCHSLFNFWDTGLKFWI